MIFQDKLLDNKKLSEKDLALWNSFTKKCKSQNDFTYTDKGKELISTIKNNLKSIKYTFETENEILSKDDFVLEKNKTLGIDKNSDIKLSKGKYLIDDKIDLHGLSLEVAYNKVKLFFGKALLSNYRCILIITGKGLHSSNKTIKSSIVDWLKEPYFSSKIIKYTDAHTPHGGSGAIYILLKRQK